jgi:hypothetical protein
MEAPETMGKKITVVTTFHPEGMSTYGDKFLESFARRVDKRIELIVYAENCKPKNPDPTRITILMHLKNVGRMILKLMVNVHGQNAVQRIITKNLNGMLYDLLIKFMLCSTL